MLKRASFDILALFAGRLGGLLVNLLFLPLYDAALGPVVFGAVSIVLAVQAFFLMFDFGLATLLGADLASAGQDAAARQRCAGIWRRSKIAVGLASVVAGVAAMAVSGAFGTGDGVVRPTDFLLAALLVAAMLLINAGQAALIADGRIRLASALQVGGAIGRSVAAMMAIHLLEPSLQSFLLGQLAILALHGLLMDGIVCRMLGRPLLHAGDDGGFLDLWRRVRMLMAYGLAGALAMQIDKPLVAHYFSLEMAGRWFLAVTYSLTPIALLAGPLHQFFFPRVVQARDLPSALLETSQQFQVATVLAVAAPCLFLAWMAPDIVSLWLRHSPDSDLVASLAAPLVLAAGFGAMGYLPTAFLIGTGRRRFAAVLSWVMLPYVAVGLAAAGHAGSIRGFQLVYCLFHVSSCLAQWLWMLKNSDRQSWGPLVIRSWLLPLVLVLFPYSLSLAIICSADLGLSARLSAGVFAGATVSVVVAWRTWASYDKSFRLG